MADFAYGRTPMTQGQAVEQFFAGGQQAEIIFGHGTQIFPRLPLELYSRTEARLVQDETALWFEFGFSLDAILTGNSATGWTDGGNYFRLHIEQSADLTTWSLGKFVPAPTPLEVRPDGGWNYWSRSTVPVYWFNVYVDLRLTSNRFGKSITEISIHQVPIPLAGYPYAMPADAARLQTDLIAAGYTGAVVSSVSIPITATAHNYIWEHQSYQQIFLPITQASGFVTGITYQNTLIPLPGYPYAMPAQRATLQADLRAAGQSGAVVRLYADKWMITLPNRLAATPTQRQSSLTFTPGDPYPVWDVFGNYLGEAAGDSITGASGNVRPAIESPVILEADKQFARLVINAGTRYASL